MNPNANFDLSTYQTFVAINGSVKYGCDILVHVVRAVKSRSSPKDLTNETSSHELGARKSERVEVAKSIVMMY